MLLSRGLCNELAAEVASKPFNADFYLGRPIVDCAYSLEKNTQVSSVPDRYDFV